MENIATIILAAGSSTRLGQPKQLVKYQNETLIKRAITTLITTGIKNGIIVLGANHTEIQKEISHAGYDSFYNPKHELGIGNSIAFGVNRVLEKWKNTDGILITLCDQPLLDQSFIKTLCSEFINEKDRIVASEYKGTFGPPVIFPKRLFGNLTMLNGDKGAKKVINEYQSILRTICNEKLSLDIDTPEDLLKLRKSDKHGTIPE